MRRTLTIGCTIWTASLTLACATANLPHPSGAAHTTAPIADASEGREVLAVVKAIRPKSYTDDLPGGKVLVSDVMQFSVVEPAALVGVSVMAHYRGVPEIDGRRLELGDSVHFRLPPAPQRDGILLGDLKGLRVGK